MSKLVEGIKDRMQLPMPRTQQGRRPSLASQPPPLSP